jgi:ERCC4-type nuclease
MDLLEAHLCLLIEKLKTEIRETKETQATFCLFVDSAEPEHMRRTLLTELNDPTLSQLVVSQRSLPSGDYWFVCNDVLLYVFERKSLSDYNGCLDDPRYSDQLFRLCHLPLPRDQITYLLENEDEKKIEHFKGKYRILSELRKLKMIYGIDVDWTLSSTECLTYIVITLYLMVHRWQKTTKELQDFFQLTELNQLPKASVLLLKASAKKEDKEQDKEEDKEEDIETQLVKKKQPSLLDNYFDFTKISKRGNDTPDNLYLNQVSGIRGMGKSKAVALAKRFPSWKTLINFLDVEGSHTLIHCLSTLPCVGKKRTQQFGCALAIKVVASLTTISSQELKKTVDKEKLKVKKKRKAKNPPTVQAHKKSKKSKLKKSSSK